MAETVPARRGNMRVLRGRQSLLAKQMSEIADAQVAYYNVLIDGGVPGVTAQKMTAESMQYVTPGDE